MTRIQNTGFADRPLYVEVVYAFPAKQIVIVTRVPAGSTVKDAIFRSGILERFPEIGLAPERVGIYGEVVSLDSRVCDGDRVEIYRPLIADPKQVRRSRIVKKPATRSGWNRKK
jgi:uncharacterized protein